MLVLLYGHPNLQGRRDTWRLIADALGKWNLLVLSIGVFNQVLFRSDKLSVQNTNICGAGWLSDLVNKFELRDVNNYGVFYTWTNNRGGCNATFEKLDRAMGSPIWFLRFPQAAVCFLLIHRSDHSPLVLDTHWSVAKKHRLKRFEEGWLQCEEVSQITCKVWELQFKGSLAFGLVQKQKVLIRHLCNWSSFSIKEFSTQIEGLKKELEHVQSKMVAVAGQRADDISNLVMKEQRLRREYDQLLERQEAYWEQRAKQKWLDLGDRNTSYFHKATTIRTRRNGLFA